MSKDIPAPNDNTKDTATRRATITLYEFYTLGIERLLVKAPWELERAVSVYHESFLTEQRCIGLAMLLLLGEDHVPRAAVQSMPKFEAQARFSVNQAIFRRALKQYFETNKLNPVRADLVIERMGSYLLAEYRDTGQGETNSLTNMYATLAKRIPPQDDAQAAQYTKRIEQIFSYVSALVDTLLTRYRLSA